MGNIKLMDGQVIPDRRTNGARIKLDIADWIKISITILTTFAVIIFGAGKLMTIVSGHTEALAQMGEKCKIMDKHEKQIAVLENDISYIKNTTEKIDIKLDKILITNEVP